MSMHESHQSIHSQQVNSCVEVLKDLTCGVEIKASSRQAMIGSLTDNSTETFWESGDEDRNKTKTITIICGAHSLPRMVYIHIDNCRDLTVSFIMNFNSFTMFLYSFYLCYSTKYLVLHFNRVITSMK